MEAEIHPLKAEEPPGPGKGVSAGAGAEAEAEGAAGRRGRRLSRWRTAAFFLSLFLCLAAVFAFSFVVPCPVRPGSERTWSRSYDPAAAYPFLAAADVDGDPVRDLLFAFRAGASSGGLGGGGPALHRPCSEAGLASPCAFMAAHAGTNGSVLWLRPVAEELLLMDCAWQHGQAPACLVLGKPDSVALLDLKTGQTLWQEAANFGANSTVLSPVLKVPDVNKDDVLDLLVFTRVGTELKSSFYSGTDGTQIGSSGTLHLPKWLGHLMHVTSRDAHYIFISTVKGLFVYSLAEIFHLSVPLPGQLSANLKEDPRWEAAIDGSTHKISLLSSGEIRSLTKMVEKPGSNILAASSTTLELVDGRHLGSMWVTNIPHILREPVLGAYDPDEVDIIAESQVSPQKKKVTIVAGPSGIIKWEVELLHPGTGSPGPTSLPTADHRSIFLFWGHYQGDTNQTGSLASSALALYLYLYHPSQPHVLLEMSNSTEAIVAFEGVLFERSRHACYMLLTGPQAGSASLGQVVLSKRKLKEDMANSRVVWLNQPAQDTEQNVREWFLRMRYRSLW